MSARTLTNDELKAIALLYALPPQEREIEQAQKRAIVPLGNPIPLIHQVLFS